MPLKVVPGRFSGLIAAAIGTLQGRLIAVVVLVSLAAIGVGGGALSLAFRTYVEDEMTQRLSDLLDAMVGVSEIAPDGVLRFSRPLFDQRFSQPYSGWYWQISEQGQPPFRSRSLWDFELKEFAVHGNGLVVHEHDGPDGQQLWVVERIIKLPEADREFYFMVAADAEQIHAATARYNLLLLGVLGFIAIALTVGLIFQLSFGLRPLRVTRQHLAEVRSGKRARMARDYPAEIQPLASEIDGLLAHNTQLLERARTHVGNLAHGLKTPLSVIRNELDHVPADLRQRLLHQLDDMTRQVDHHLRRARMGGVRRGRGVDVAEHLSRTARAIERLYQDRGVRIHLDVAPDICFDGEGQDFDELIGNLIENAGKWARRDIHVTCHPLPLGAGRAQLKLSISDDGPGVPAAERESLFERGRRLDETKPGSGLGLAIVRDIVDLYGGSASIGESAAGGLAVSLLLPRCMNF